ncbi:hypothetical protein ACFTAO_37620 [Paenibacillus rhizoplanae]
MGTGPGFFSILLSQMGHQPTAVDASQGMILVLDPYSVHRTKNPPAEQPG